MTAILICVEHAKRVLLSVRQRTSILSGLIEFLVVVLVP